MNQINILYLHQAVDIAGAENSLLSLVKNINRLKFRPFFILPREGNFSKNLKKLDIEIDFIEFHRPINFFNFLKDFFKIIRIIKNEKIDLIHSNDIRTHLYASLAGKIYALPVVWHERNLITTEIIDPERLLYFLPDRIICNSYAVARRFLKKGQLVKKVKVIYSGVDVNDFNPDKNGDKIRQELSIRPEEIVIGLVGRFHAIKGHETFLQAAQILIDSPDPIGNMRFLIVGSAVFKEDKWREAFLGKLVDDLGLAEKVVFAGFREDMPEIYASMDIVVLASLAEAFGRVVLEGMASGRPVIGTNSGGTPEVIIDGVNGFLFEPGDSVGLANKINTLINNRKQTKEIKEAARKTIEEKFRIEQNVSQIEAVYSELIQFKC